MEELSERKLIQKEQERERRRIRDRRRRQSMTVEEREKHLARRRRNYQLRRLKAENSRLNLLTTTAVPSTAAVLSAAVIDSNVTPVQCLNNVTPVGLEIPADKLCKLPTRLRLIHLKHLARSLDFHQNEIDNGNGNSICGNPQAGLRLNRVKRLARSLNSDLEKSTPENEGAMKEKNLLNGQNPPPLPVSTNGENMRVVEVEQPYLFSCGNK